MKPMISPRRMQECERAFFRAGSVPSIDVMERAARALADAIAAELPAGGRIDFACGPGGNGGDNAAPAVIPRFRPEKNVLKFFLPPSPDTAP